MGLITKLFFAIGAFFEWTFPFLEVIGYYCAWFLTILGFVLICWWLAQLLSFGNKNEKKYGGW